MPERFRGELLTVGRYTNPASFTFLFYNAPFPTVWRGHNNRIFHTTASQPRFIDKWRRQSSEALRRYCLCLMSDDI